MALSLLHYASAQSLQSIELVHVNDKTQEVRYNFDSKVALPKHFITGKVVVIDFAKTRFKAVDKNRQINNNLIKSINNQVGAGKVRSSINLVSPATDYSVTSTDTSIIISLSSKNSQLNQSPAWKDDLSGNNQDGGNADVIDFRRTSKSSALITIQLPSEDVRVQASEGNRKLNIKLNGHSWASGEEKRLDVTDFGTTVKQVEVINSKGSAQVNIATQGSYEYSAYQTGSKYTIEIKPKRDSTKESSVSGIKTEGFKGELLSLNFQDIEVRAVLQIIADFTGLNIVVSDSVSSRVTVRLIDVPWDQALNVVLKTKGLGMRQEGQVIYVAPHAELIASEDQEKLVSEIVQINYAKATDVAAVLLDGKKGGTGAGTASAGLSHRGTVSVDGRTNNLIIQDVSGQIKTIKELIEILDQPIRQVMIEAKVIVTTDDYARDLGVRWGGSGIGRIREDGTGNFAVGGSESTLDSFIDKPYTKPLGGLINMPAGNPTTSLAFAILRKNFHLDLELSAMQESGRGEVLASPRVLTADRQAAYIKSGTSIPFYQNDGDGNTTANWKDVVLSLEVTPQITPDNKIILDLTVTKDDLTTSSSADIAIATNELKTQAIVADGETIVLGGVYSESVREVISKVPLLGDIPIVGNLFRKKLNSTTKVELLVFVTPHIQSTTTNVNR
ncbi:pilus assembly protein PilQ [Gammaproteobacteria bacterium]|nr:pilus assembly protein PilQ [Gammaproteobacteria bacterium]